MYYKFKVQNEKAKALKIFNFRRQGFTLLEIMIALAIIGITVTVILHTVNYHANIMYENTLTTQMYQIAKEKMYDLEKTQKKSRGNIKKSGLAYENIVFKSEDSNIVELKIVIRGYDKEVILNKLVLKKEISNL